MAPRRVRQLNAAPARVEPATLAVSFENIANTFDALIEVLALERMFLYVHDYGAGVAYQLALRRPERVLGLIVQNGSAHDEGMDRIWEREHVFFRLSWLMFGTSFRNWLIRAA